MATATAFVPSNPAKSATSALQMKAPSTPEHNENGNKVTKSIASTRKAFLASLITTSVSAGMAVTANADDDESFASIAARAASMAQKVEKDEDEASAMRAKIDSDPRTAYDFSLPMVGEAVPFDQLIRQEFTEVKTENVVKVKNEDGSEGTSTVVDVKKDAKVKAILVVNMKQDDPIARKNIPEFISLASKFGRNGEFVVIMSPTDQGYFEPDTSALIRLKLASEYGYGINPATIVTDKLNLLGTGAHPFWRWIEGSCRAPSGLGRIQGNFEKFLIDGRTGKSLRRYPRKYQPFDIAEDIDSIMKGKALPPAGANWKEEWRNSDKEAERDVYRFQKGLNVFDQ